MDKVFRGLGIVTGRFYNLHEDWKQAPEWVKTHYKLEEQQHCGDITTIPQGVLKGAVDAVAEYAKANPGDAITIGTDIAKVVGISKENGIAFAGGFVETAQLPK